jgi:hypothetical protein
MSANAVALLTANQGIVNTNLAKIFIFNNDSQSGTFEYENTDEDVVILAGTVLGRIAATNKLAIINKDASDGSQFPVGILMQDITVAYGETFSGNVYFVVSGDVAEAQIKLPTGTTLETVISAKTLADRIASDTVGIRIVPTTDQTDYDNQ